MSSLEQSVIVLKSQVAALTNQVRSLSKWGYISENMVEEADWPYQNVEYLGRGGSPSLPWFPYGFHSSPPAGEACIVISMQGDEGARVHFAGSPAKRPAIGSGEVILYHPDTGSYFWLKADGSIEIEAPTTTVKGDFVVEGAVTFESTLEVQALSTLAGVTTSGATVATFGATITSNGVDISDTHSHGVGSYVGNGTGNPILGISGDPV